MKKIKLYLTIALVGIVMSSCSVSSYTRAGLYPKMYEEKPGAILVMPPINNTTNVEAKELLYTSISHPLIEAGYYVVSPHIAMEFLKSESAYDSERFFEGDMTVFGNIFGVDAVIFSVIDKWVKSGFGIQTNITYIVKSTKTNETLFERKCELYLDLQQNSGTGTTFGALLDVVTSAIVTATTDHISAARKCNKYIFSDIPRGKYSPSYGTDMETIASERDAKVTVK